jgi:toxin YoeB
MEIILFEQAQKDIAFWKKSGNKGIMKRISALLEDIEKTPYTGIGKPEGLKHELSGWWSRRINKEHRLIYRMVDNQIQVLSLRYHYD